MKDLKYELIVIGNTNVGKSTFLNNLTKMDNFFKTSSARETSCIWRFTIVPDEAQEAPYVLRTYQIDPQSVTDEAKTKKHFDIYMNKVELPPKEFFDETTLVAEMSKEMEVRREAYRRAKLEPDVTMMNP